MISTCTSCSTYFGSLSLPYIIVKLMSNATAQNTPLQGWTNSPDGRGTIDIVSSCIFTNFICVWSVLCINIGPPGESAIAQFLQKLKLALICILGPDFLLLLVIGQWESARSSCRQFKEAGLDGWSMRHAFYADMGGFVVRTKDGVTWPLDANQLHYLIVQGLIKEPVLTAQIILKKSDIDDRNKQNTLVRAFSAAQILWFLISCIARGVQRLAVTTLELTTIGFITTTICVCMFWFHKPADVETRQTIEIEATVPDLHTKAGLDSAYTWYDTPLDFLGPEKTYFGVAWQFWMNLLSAIHILPTKRFRPIRRRPDDAFLPVSRYGMIAIVAAGSFSWGANFVAWDFDFPTTLERQIWRASSTLLLIPLLIGLIYQEILLIFFPDMRKNACLRFASQRRMTDLSRASGEEEKFSSKFRGKTKRIVLWLSNNSPNADPSLTLQLRVLIPALFFSALYALARAYLLLEDLLAFRGQNPDVYKTVNWVDFLPHV
ncbi:uncharacterized protein PAC_05287 [Phialocephala subalpina]|uniref:Uncharacterized protein n=1 Tax=Phialocephala subalpina TaxID=576137 RepID=A0A1L7WRK6_9HELO|nr:uncharacterized protein PAC_05287 [Phialocephala subalpina]